MRRATLREHYESAAEDSYDPEPIRSSFSVKRIAKDDDQAGGLILKTRGTGAGRRAARNPLA